MSAATWPGTELGAGLEILESTIPGAGWGLFATRPFPKWAVITTYAGTWVNRKDYGLYPCKTHTHTHTHPHTHTPTHPHPHKL
jgi:hypothetical protein